MPDYQPLFSDPQLSEALVHAIPLPVFYKDPQGRYLGCNTAFCKMLGIYERDIIGKTVFDLNPAHLASIYHEKDQELLKSKGAQAYEARFRFADGKEHEVYFNEAVFYDTNGALGGVIGVVLDISDRVKAERKVAFQATHDALTGLINRYELRTIIDKNHAQAVRHKDPYSIILMDLDRFKLLNDTYGHANGDKVLKSVAATLEREARASDWFGRWGGEEFICLLPKTDNHEASLVAERMRRKVETTPLSIGGRNIKLTTSIGVTSFPEDGDSPETLLAAVDEALYEAKHAGRNRIRHARHQAVGIYSMAGQLETALEQGLLKAAYQPIVELATERVVAEEALTRIRLSDSDILVADQFIEAASHLQLAHKIDHYMAAESLARCTHLIEEGRLIKHFVNFSVDLLRHPNLVDDIIQQATDTYGSDTTTFHGVKPLVIEITEREFLGNIKEARNTLAPLIDFGMQLAIDDFGSGYSSFQYLADLPISFLKIEGGLIRRVKSEKKVRSIVTAMQEIATELGLISIAEHIEDQETADILRDIGVDWGQGFLFGKAEF